MSLIGTFLFINIVLLVFLWERKAVKIQNDVPSIADMNIPTHQREIITQKVGSKKHGDYIVEDFEAVEVWYDQNGKVIRKEPTGEHTYLRYWDSKKEKIITDDHSH
jgi:hypothetical protein